MKIGKVILGIAGSISAYKSVEIIRLLRKNNVEVKVILTKGGQQFITPLLTSSISGNETVVGFSDSENNWNNHVDLAQWADLMLFAPASANAIAKMAIGLCDEPLYATYLSATCKKIVCPAMDHDMWHSPAVQRNITTLKMDGVQIVPPMKGELASGLFGDGRLPEPNEIVSIILDV